jgi:hypothetical protein
MMGALRMFIQLHHMWTIAPPDGAGPLSVIVRFTLAPLTGSVGYWNEAIVTGTGATVSVVVFEIPPAAAVRVTEVWAPTVPAVIVTFAVRWFEATLTDAGTLIAALLLDRLTGNPSDGALPVSEIVAVACSPDFTDNGVIVMPDTEGGEIVIAPLRVSARVLALSMTTCCVATGLVVTGTVCDDWPSAMVIVGDVSCANVELTESAISNPFAFAGAEIVIVAVDEVPPVTVAGLNTTDTRVGWPCACTSIGTIDISNASDFFIVSLPRQTWRLSIHPELFPARANRAK